MRLQCTVSLHVHVSRWGNECLSHTHETVHTATQRSGIIEFCVLFVTLELHFLQVMRSESDLIRGLLPSDKRTDLTQTQDGGPDSTSG